MTEEEIIEIQNETADFLAQIAVIKRAATKDQWAKFLAKIDDDARKLIYRFFKEMENFPPRRSPFHRRLDIIPIRRNSRRVFRPIR